MACAEARRTPGEYRRRGVGTGYRSAEGAGPGIGSRIQSVRLLFCMSPLVSNVWMITRAGGGVAL